MSITRSRSVLRTLRTLVLIAVAGAGATTRLEPPSAADEPRGIEAAFERLRIMRESLPPADIPAADMIRELRDEGV